MRNHLWCPKDPCSHGIDDDDDEPQKIISGLRETFIKRYTVERTDKAELRLEEESEKAELLGEFME